MTVALPAHAKQQMELRGATEAEVKDVVEHGVKEPALQGRVKAQLTFDFNQSRQSTAGYIASKPSKLSGRKSATKQSSSLFWCITQTRRLGHEDNL